MTAPPSFCLALKDIRLATPPPLPPRLPSGAPSAMQGPLTWRTYVWVFFRFDGRVGRQVYWLSIIFLSALIGLTSPFVIDAQTGTVVPEFGPFQSLVYTIATISSITITIKRLHDLNMTGFFAIGMFILPIAIIMSLWLGFRKGDQGPNKYGWETDVVPNRPPPQMPDEDNE